MSYQAILVMTFGFSILVSKGWTFSEANRTPNAEPTNSTPRSVVMYNTVESEALMDYIEALPRRTIKKLLDDDELTDFVSAYEKQIFDQDIVFVRHSDYWILHDAVAQKVTSSQMSMLLSLFTYNVTLPVDSLPDDVVVGSKINASAANFSSSTSANSTDRLEYPDYDICKGSFESSPQFIRANYSQLPAVRTLVRMEHVVAHPIIQIYATKLGLARILKHPNLLQQLKTKKNKFLTVLFLDMSLISLLETKIICYKLLTEESMMVRFSVAFGKTLNALELSAIPSYFSHVSQFTARALNRSSVIVELKDRNYTSPVIEIDSENQDPCLFFNLLRSCENGGICVGFTGIGNCRCRSGFNGKFCRSLVKLKNKQSNSVLHLWMNFVYMLVGVVLLSATLILFGNFLKSRREKGKTARGEVVVGVITAPNSEAGVTPYQLPRISVTNNSSPHQLRTRTLGDRGCGASYSIKKRLNESLNTSRRESTSRSDRADLCTLSPSGLRYDHLTVP